MKSPICSVDRKNSIDDIGATDLISLARTEVDGLKLTRKSGSAIDSVCKYRINFGILQIAQFCEARSRHVRIGASVRALRLTTKGIEPDLVRRRIGANLTKCPGLRIARMTRLQSAIGKSTMRQEEGSGSSSSALALE